ncbi:hypothetical protein DFJ74DRAFT_709199 [Hyaloraphidium curvatum]|nr:hypothetical protein DFJ74DRAFT_709199 [Hyaloraphidium curvatum]
MDGPTDLFNAPFSPATRAAISSGLELLDTYLAHFNSRRPAGQTSTLAFPLLLPPPAPALLVPSVQAYADADAKALAHLTSRGWGYSLWHSRRIVCAGPHRVALDIEFGRYAPDGECFGAARSLYVASRRETPGEGEWGIQLRGTTAGGAIWGTAAPEADSEIARRVRERFPDNAVTVPERVRGGGPTDPTEPQLHPSYPAADPEIQACVRALVDFAISGRGEPSLFAERESRLLPPRGQLVTLSHTDFPPPPRSESNVPYDLAVRVPFPGPDSAFVDVALRHSAPRAVLGYPLGGEDGVGGRTERAVLVLRKGKEGWRVAARCVVDGGAEGTGEGKL